MECMSFEVGQHKPQILALPPAVGVTLDKSSYLASGLSFLIWMVGINHSTYTLYAVMGSP